MPSNTAAWLTAEKATPLEVKPAEYTLPGANEILVKNHAVALNLVDWARQTMGNELFAWVKYPCILGSDVAGEVVEVGPGVNNFELGDKVLGLATALYSNRAAEAAFQTYTVLHTNLASTIPSKVSYEDAAVIPLAVATAACGLYQKDYLGLLYPEASRRSATGETILIWGGASSVGTNAIQLAVASGYEVFSTSSPKNWDYLKKLGASQVFDYHSRTVVEDISKAFIGRKSVGALAIGQNTAGPCSEIVAKVGGKKFVASANAPPAELPEGVSSKFILLSELRSSGVEEAVFGNFIPAGLKNGSFVPSPPSRVIGNSLAAIQNGLEELKKGTSAEKLVIVI
ncbi:LAMI_0A00232g1_1 [Lachancea mirantina]|uniref:LAMI_0A00232g1_1 n=1 Tax=Lachancea mirantina TaxID=1230905 RepID=A0A1G4IL14_9SACH|nr:LAMI_0A00232g1_1 [Lachancea mirantina]